MAFCKQCGAQLAEDAKFCASCGAAVQSVASQPQQDPTSSTSIPPIQPQPSVQQTQSSTPLTEEQDIQQNKTMAVLSYILFFVPLLIGTHKTSPYVKFHVNQGTVLFIFSLAWGLALSIIIGIVSSIFGFVGLTPIAWLIRFAGGILRYIPLALVIYGVVNALNGVKKELPIIGKLNIIK